MQFEKLFRVHKSILRQVCLGGMFWAFFSCTGESQDDPMLKSTKLLENTHPVPNPEKTLSPPEVSSQESAIRKINFLSRGVLSTHPIETYVLWSAQKTDFAQVLSEGLQAENQSMKPTLQTVLWVIVLDKETPLPKIPHGNRHVYVLRGEWSEIEMTSLYARSEGIVLASKSTERFIDATDASEVDLALGSLFELRWFYDRQRLQLHPLCDGDVGHARRLPRTQAHRHLHR